MRKTILAVMLSVITLNGFAFDVRGFHLDLRSQVMTMPALKAYAKELSEMNINTLIMEWEATFPYQQHATITNRLAYNPQEIKKFIAYCTSLGIDVIPLHHCFGHAEWFLRHDRYRYLSEDKKEVSQVCPMKEVAAVKEFTSMFKEMAAYHPSKYFHIGCDETYLLGSCKECQAKVAKEGKSKLFVDYVKTMCKIVTDMGKIPVLWADIIIKYPESISEMPKEAVYVDWNYGWNVDHFGDMNKLYNTGVTIWGAPSLRSSPDNMHLTRWDVHFNNQRDFIPYGRKVDYKGMIMTSWSTSGLYSFFYDQGWEIQDMEQVRNVYPLNGFRILLAAYGQSITQKDPLDPQLFVVKYAQERLGMSEDDGQELWKILSTPQETIRGKKSTKGRETKEVLEESISLRDRVYKLVVKKNQTEVEHFKLMFDLRVVYLRFKTVEAVYQSNSFNRSQAKELYAQISAIIAEAEKLDARFTNLHKGFITDFDIRQQNEIRKRKMYVVRDFLKAQID